MTDTQQLVTVEDVLSLVGDDGTFWNVRFIKRTTGEERTMTGRRGVKKYVKGGGLKYSRKEKRLVGFWIPEDQRREDGKDNGYRNIPVEGILELKAHGRRWKVENGVATEVPRA